jgi:predicted nuclease with TOPRIM domain
MIESLTADAERLRKDNTDMKEQLGKFPELEKTTSSLVKEKSGLLEQVSRLTTELKGAKDNIDKANKELAALTDKCSKVQQAHDDLKARNSELLLKKASLQAESEKAYQAVQTASNMANENANLKALVDKFKVSQVAPAGEEGKVVLENKILALEEQKGNLQVALQEWTALAKASFLTIPLTMGYS